MIVRKDMSPKPILTNFSVSSPMSIKSACSHDPVEAVQLVWERQDERFGNVESVHAAIMNNLEKFPKLDMKDAVKLYELCDILLEIKTMKENPVYKSALSFFDSSIGLQQLYVNYLVTYKRSGSQLQARIRHQTKFRFPHLKNS